MVGAHRGDPPMTVRTADLALADLFVDRGETAPMPGKLCHRCALGPDVVELEDDGVSLSAIHARVAAQDIEYVREVPRDVRIRVRTRRNVRCCGAPPPAADGGPTAMAVRADDLTSGDLGVDGPRRRCAGDQLRDARRLLTEVIELEDDRIGLAAIDARVMTEMVEYLGAQGSLSRQLGGVRLSSVCVASLAEVGCEAGPTPPLQPIAVPVEAFDGEVVSAPATASQPAGFPYAQASCRNGVARTRWWPRCSRRPESAHPHAHRRFRDPELPRDAGEGPAELAAETLCCFASFVLPSHEQMFASSSDGTWLLDCAGPAPMV